MWKCKTSYERSFKLQNQSCYLDLAIARWWAVGSSETSKPVLDILILRARLKKCSEHFFWAKKPRRTKVADLNLCPRCNSTLHSLSSKLHRPIRVLSFILSWFHESERGVNYNLTFCAIFLVSIENKIYICHHSLGSFFFSSSWVLLK